MEQGTIMGMYIALMISTIIPLLVILYLGVSKILKMKTFSIGVLTFFITQMVISSPLLNYLQRFPWMQTQWISRAVTICVVVVTEVISAWLVFSYFLKQQRSYMEAVSYGVGRGMVGTVFLIGISCISNISLSTIIMDGSIYDLKDIDINTINQIVSVLTTDSGFTYVASAIQEIGNLMISIFITVIVVSTITKKDFKLLLILILVASIVKAVGIYIGMLSPTIMVIYTFIIMSGLMWNLMKLNKQKLKYI